MAVFTALKKVPSAILRNPILIGVFAVFGLLQTPPLLAQMISPTAAILVSFAFMAVTLLATPFIYAGIVAVADEALKGRTHLGTFVESGKRNYLSILGAYLLLLAVFMAFGVLAVLGFIVTGVSVGLAGAAESGGIFVMLGVFVLIGLAFAALVLFTQFYGQEIVLNDAGAVAGLKGSVSLVRDNFVSTLGYTVLVSIVGGTFGLVISIPSALLQETAQPTGDLAAATTAQLSPTLLVGVVAVYVVSTATIGMLLAVYAVAFYNELREKTDSRGGREADRAVTR